ncbi:MAG: polysaccharide pyruvyl transferase family protein [Eubacterium sp.]|nr:polysaccharide pyruvyl transferase family protein [Eubacterium sp.]
MRVGILTYHRSHNYGAFLQAYSLCQKLNKYESVECEIVNYNLASEDEVYKKKRWKRPIYSITYIKQDHMFDDVQKEQILSGDLMLENDYKKVLDYLDGKYDVLVTGSDEIWRKASRGFPNVYWLPGNHSFIKMSYAASGRMMVENLSDEMKKQLKDFYQDYKYVGVRDECTKMLVDSILGETKSIRNCDPTFFYDRFKDKEELKQIIRKKYKLPNKKIVAVVYDRPSLIKELRKRLGKEYYFVCLTRPMYNANKNLCYVDPFEWADIIGGVDFVVTAYYHPMLFALNQNTPFMAIDRRANKKTIETSKLFDLLSYSHMEDRYGMSEDISDEFWDRLAERIINETNNSNVDFSNTIEEQKKMFDSFERELLSL